MSSFQLIITQQVSSLFPFPSLKKSVPHKGMPDLAKLMQKSRLTMVYDTYNYRLQLTTHEKYRILPTNIYIIYHHSTSTPFNYKNPMNSTYVFICFLYVSIRFTVISSHHTLDICRFPKMGVPPVIHF